MVLLHLSMVHRRFKHFCIFRKCYFINSTLMAEDCSPDSDLIDRYTGDSFGYQTIMDNPARYIFGYKKMEILGIFLDVKT